MVLRTGLIGMLFCWGVYALQMATNHMVVHIMTHGIGGGTGPEAQAQLQELAQTIYAVGGALHIGFLAISCVASILLGLGLASRFSEMNPYKAAAYGLVFIGVLLLLNLIILQHIHDVNISGHTVDFPEALSSSAPPATSSLESGCTRVVESCFLTEAKARFATLKVRSKKQ